MAKKILLILLTVYVLWGMAFVFADLTTAKCYNLNEMQAKCPVYRNDPRLVR